MSQAIASFEGRRKPDFRTPKSFIEWLENRNGRPFTLDVAASKENAICENYFDQESNGLLNNWSGQVWCNPPYGRAIADWLNKCAIEITRKEVDSIWVLIPARTDTKWFHELVMPHAYLVYLIKGRIEFNHDTTKAGAPFPSMLIVYRKHKLPDAGITVLDVPKEARRDE